MHTSKSSIHRETPEIVLRSIFQRYDIDGNGTLDPLEFASALEDLGVVDHTEQKALFSLADSSNNKSVSIDDFVKLIKSNDFEAILSTPKDYEFVIETYKAFQQYDDDGDGEVSWSEFYFHLTKHGYSHQYISQYWYYMNQENKTTMSFEGFWKGFKAQNQALAARNLQKQINEQIVNKKKKKKNYNKTLKRPSLLKLVRTNSWNNDGQNNVFNYMKRHLTPSKHLRNRSPYALKLGKVSESSHLKGSYSLSNVQVPSDIDDISIPCGQPLLLESQSVYVRSSQNVAKKDSHSFSESSQFDVDDRDDSMDRDIDNSYPPIVPVLLNQCRSEVISSTHISVSFEFDVHVFDGKRESENISKRNSRKKKKKNKKRKRTKGKKNKSSAVDIDRSSVLFPSKKKKKSSHKTVQSAVFSTRN